MRRRRPGRATTWRVFSAPCATRARVQRADLLPEVVEHGVGDVVGIDVGEPRPRRPGGSTRSAAPGPAVPATTTGGHAHAGAFREQQRVGLVLDVLEPGEVQLRARRPCRASERQNFDIELRVGFVAAEHADQQRPVVVAPRA